MLSHYDSTIPLGDPENESRNDFNVRRSASNFPVKKLFQTPASKPPRSSVATPLVKDSVTKKYFRSRHSVATPLPIRPQRPSNAPATGHRCPSQAIIGGTPSVRRKLIVFTREIWLARQEHDLSAWLNAVLCADSTLSSSYFPADNIASSVVFLRSVASLHDLYRKPEVHKVLQGISKAISTDKLFVSRKVRLSSHVKPREDLISLLLVNYHPVWLLLGLCVVLGQNFAIQLDARLEKAKQISIKVDTDVVFMEVLEDVISHHLLSEELPKQDCVTTSSQRKISPTSKMQEEYNAIVLERTLNLVYLLDIAKDNSADIVSADPPLFRSSSEMTSSNDVLIQLGSFFLQEQGDIVRFLSMYKYRLTYVTPLFEQMSSLEVSELLHDMRDGTRLCKLASIMSRDRAFLSKVGRVKSSMPKRTANSLSHANVSLALGVMKEHASLRKDKVITWCASSQDIIHGIREPTLQLLWQIAALWIETVVLDKDALLAELSKVQQQYREARKSEQRGIWSPRTDVDADGKNMTVESPTSLPIYQNCPSECNKLLLQWAATVCGMYGVKVREFTESFRDGAALCILLHHYFPELVAVEEIKPVPAAELRSSMDHEVEYSLVQGNFDLFAKRSRFLGTIPNIPISVDTALAPPFIPSLKAESFGRLMELYTSYLFRRFVLQKKESEAKERVDRLMCSNLEENICNQAAKVITAALRQELLLQKLMADAERKACSESTSSGTIAMTGSEYSRMTAVEDSSVYLSSPDSKVVAALDKEVSQIPQLIMAVKSSSGGFGEEDEQRDTQRKRAAETILRYYRGAKARKAYLGKRRSIIQIQASFRGRVSRQRCDRLLEQRRNAVKTLENAWKARSIHQEPIPDAIKKRRGALALLAQTASERSSRLLQHTSSLLPSIRAFFWDLDSYSSSFTEQMVTHERNQASQSIQNVYRKYIASVRWMELREEKENEIEYANRRYIWGRVATEAANIGAMKMSSFARLLAEAVEETRQKNLSILGAALHAAEDAFNTSMSKLSADAENTRQAYSEHVHRANAIREDLKAERRSDNENLKKEVALLQSDIVSLESKWREETESLEECEYLLAVDAEEEEIIENISSAISQNKESESSFTDGTKDHERVIRSTEKLCSDLDMEYRREKEICKQLDEFHNIWTMQVREIEEDLERHIQYRRTLGEALDTAAEKYVSFMRNAEAAAVMYKKAFYSSRQEHTARRVEEETQMKEFALERDTIQKDLSVLEMKTADLQQAVSTACSRRSEISPMELEDLLELIDITEEQAKISDDCYKDSAASFESEVQKSISAVREYESWSDDSEVVEKQLDDSIESYETIDIRNHSMFVRFSEHILRSLHGIAVKKFDAEFAKCRVASITRTEKLRSQELARFEAILENERKAHWKKYETDMSVDAVMCEHLESCVDKLSWLAASYQPVASIANASEEIMNDISASMADARRESEVYESLQELMKDVLEAFDEQYVLAQLHEEDELDNMSEASSTSLLRSEPDDELEDDIASFAEILTNLQNQDNWAGKAPVSASTSMSPSHEMPPRMEAMLEVVAQHKSDALAQKPYTSERTIDHAVELHNDDVCLQDTNVLVTENYIERLDYSAPEEEEHGAVGSRRASRRMMYSPQSDINSENVDDSVHTGGEYLPQSDLHGSDFTSSTGSLSADDCAEHCVVITGCLDELSSELDEFNIRNSPQSVRSLLQDSAASDQLGSTLRRISSATQSVQAESELKNSAGSGYDDESKLYRNIIPTVLTVIRACFCSQRDSELFDMALSIIRNLSVGEETAFEIVSSVESIDLLSTCVQYYRYDQAVLGKAVEVLRLLTSHDSCREIMKKDTIAINRLLDINDILMADHEKRKQDMDRRRRADTILAVLARRKNSNANVSLSADIANETLTMPLVTTAMDPPHHVLVDVLKCLT